MVGATRKLALSIKGRILDLGIDSNTRQLQKVREQLLVICATARGPSRFQQKRHADGDLAGLDQARDLGATSLRHRPELQARPGRVIEQQHRSELEALHAIGRRGILPQRALPHTVSQTAPRNLRGCRLAPQPRKAGARPILD